MSHLCCTGHWQHAALFHIVSHGLCAGAGFLPWMPSFNKWFGGLKPITLTASVIFFPPFIRDIAGWAGFRQVGGPSLSLTVANFLEQTTLHIGGAPTAFALPCSSVVSTCHVELRLSKAPPQLPLPCLRSCTHARGLSVSIRSIDTTQHALSSCYVLAGAWMLPMRSQYHITVLLRHTISLMEIRGAMVTLTVLLSVGQWLSCCHHPQVSKHTFLAALKERGAVLFCPGGQAEMVHAWKAFLPADSRELVLHTRHRGFCRCV